MRLIIHPFTFFIARSSSDSVYRIPASSDRIVPKPFSFLARPSSCFIFQRRLLSYSSVGRFVPCRRHFGLFMEKGSIPDLVLPKQDSCTFLIRAPHPYYILSTSAAFHRHFIVGGQIYYKLLITAVTFPKTEQFSTIIGSILLFSG